MRINILKIFSFLVVLILMAKTGTGQQEPQYSQYLFNVQSFNPAYSGTWESIGVTMFARQQWAGYEGAPATYSFTMQAPMRNDHIAFGLNVANDKIGFEKRLSFNADYSYQVKLSETTSLSFGLKAGITNYTNSLSEYRLYEEGDPRFLGNIENRVIPNVGTGVFLYNENFYLGLSVPKLIENKIKNNYNNFASGEFRSYYLATGYVFSLSEGLMLKPALLLKAAEGVPLQADISANFLLKEKLWLGALFRTGKTYGFVAQWIFDKKLRLGYAVDFSYSTLRNFGHGTHEVMVSYEISSVKDRIISPRHF